MSVRQEENLLIAVMGGRVLGEIERTSVQRFRLLYAPGLEPDQTPLSLSMPISMRRHREKTVRPWLEGLLPDNPQTLASWRRQLKVPDESAFSLLKYVGEDVAGAVQFVRPGEVDVFLSRPATKNPLTEREIAQMLQQSLQRTLTFPTPSRYGKFSLTGAQAKIALHFSDREWSDPAGSLPSTHILKPRIPQFEDQDLVEHATMLIAKRVGLLVADTQVQEFAGKRALVVRRYDRVGHGSEVLRVHQEDMCQAMALSPRKKYEEQGGPSAAAVSSLISRYSTGPKEEDNRRFVQALIFNWLVEGTDAHARNYSFLLSGPHVRLAPLYDINSFLPFATAPSSLSMSVNGKYRADQITRQDWLADANVLGVDPAWLSQEIDRLAGTLPEVSAQVVDDVLTQWGYSSMLKILKERIASSIRNKVQI